MAKTTTGRYGGYTGNSSDEMFAVKEAYKAIRTNLFLSVIHEGCKRIVFSSPNPSEGKSTTASNVAISIAQAYKKVLLIDCDLRKPKVHRALGLSNTPGLTNVLGNLDPLASALRETKYPNLTVLTAGLHVPTPSEMLSSERMTKLMDTLSADFDYIIMDTPPINIVADALPLIKNSDGIVMVVRHMQSTYNELQKAVSSINFIGGKILGVVLNDTRGEAKQGYRSKYGYGYGYGYGNHSASADTDEGESAR